ncbi:hypothetical protein JCM6882_002205 [Rhodosporidiobolus microsporus]
MSLQRHNSSHDLRLVAAANNLRIKEAGDKYMQAGTADLEDICRRQAFTMLYKGPHPERWFKPLTGWKKYIGEKWWHGLDDRERRDMAEMVHDEVQTAAEEKAAFDSQLQELMSGRTPAGVSDHNLAAFGAGRRAVIYGRLRSTVPF